MFSGESRITNHGRREEEFRSGAAADRGLGLFHRRLHRLEEGVLLDAGQVGRSAFASARAARSRASGERLSASIRARRASAQARDTRRSGESGLRVERGAQVVDLVVDPAEAARDVDAG